VTVSAPRILVVDDEPQIHRFLRPALEVAGYEPLRAGTGTEALRLAAASDPSLVLLDLGLPDLDGQALIPRLRAFSQVPVVVLSARDREEEKVAALDAGADDYVEKPFDLERRVARVEGEVLRLTPREWDLLTALARASGRVATHRQLLATVWGPAHTEDAQYLRVYVGHLRQKLGAAASLLRTEPGVGYRFGEAE